ncbi:MAG: polyketide cyclase [Phenylobacterium sp.]|uniref:SRPBCC family protein n=1 Tax=Phenylobacterium sp. TaxID=1871053 RepID=UPI0025DEC38F|nr:SRPBCC family protein [Phenylobacterium sp.]MBI1197406.1 polyketide cyclase [Phenylobacterium sp.]
MATPVDIAPSHDRELVLARIIDATPAQVFRCWTTPERYPEWFCPKPWRAEVEKMDLRPGGAANTVMHGPNGEVMPNRGVYLEVVANRKLVFTDAYTEGWVPTEDGGMMTAVLTFEPHGDGQTLYVARCGHPTVDKRKQHEQMGFHDGWGVCAEQMEALAKTL